MNSNGWAVLLAVVGVLGLACGLIALSIIWVRLASERVRPGVSGREPSSPPARRVDVIVSDWGPEHGEMRWRWTIWDADPSADDRAQETTIVGYDVPFMLGNAPTRTGAFDAAMGWISAQGGVFQITLRYGAVD